MKKSNRERYDTQSWALSLLPVYTISKNKNYFSALTPESLAAARDILIFSIVSLIGSRVKQRTLCSTWTADDLKCDLMPLPPYVQDEGGGVRCWKPFRKLIQPALDLVISLMVCVCVCVMGLYKRRWKNQRERYVCVRYLLVEGNSEELNGYTQHPGKRKRWGRALDGRCHQYARSGVGVLKLV